MSPTLRAPVLVPGVATGVGSLPHDDPVAAAELVLRCLPELPAAPQLPGARPAGGDARPVARWRSPRSRSRPTASLTVLGDSDAAPDASSTTARTRASSRSSTWRRGAEQPPVAGEGAGHRPADARHRAARRRHARAAGVPPRARRSRVRGRSRSKQLVDARLPDTGLVLFLDEPALVSWRRDNAPLDRESAIDVLSGALAAVDSVTGVHVCGDGDLALALEAGPEVLGVEVQRRPRAAHRRLWRASSTATAGSRGARCRPTDRSANRPIRTGACWRACGASSRGAGAIRCRCARAG